MSFMSIKKSKAAVVVGLDFGTTFSGFAYALSSEPEKVHKFYEWPHLGEAGGRNYCKTQTSLLYEAGDTPGSYVLKDWAYSGLVRHAREVSSLKLNGPKLITQGGTRLDLTNRTIGAPSNEFVPSKFHFLTRFKLLLATSETGPTSAPNLPTGLAPRRVISDYLAKMSELILRVLQENIGSHISTKDIQWCVTVPAIWHEAGKQEMLTCAEIAGLVAGPACTKPGASPHPCIIVLEPEAASVYCQRNPKIDFPMEAGDKFLVVDIGGGTVDLVLHEKVGPKSTVKVKEVSPSSGGLCGGTYVDQAFFKFLTKKISCFEDILQEQTASILTLKGKWETIKYGFDGSDAYGYDLELPARLARAWEEHENKSEFSSIVESYDAIDLSLKDMHSIFDPVVDQILDLIEEKLIPDVKAMLVVGGFAGSPYLVKRIRESFTSRVGTIIVPNEPGSAICCGAVIYGAYGPDIISSRIAKKTYGTEFSRKYRTGDPKESIFQDEDGEPLCSGAFDIFTRKGDEIPLNHEVAKLFYPIYSYQTKVSIDLYSTENLNPSYVSDPGVQKEGSFLVPHPPATELGEKAEISVSLYFGRTTIDVTAVVKNSGDGKTFAMLPVSFERSFE